jgi:hypothetical protein
VGSQSILLEHIQRGIGVQSVQLPNAVNHCYRSIYQPNYALNKIYLEASIKLLHVSTPGCHRQGVILNKGV